MAIEAFKLGDPDREPCVPLSYNFVNEYDFLEYSESAQFVRLVPSE